VCSYKQGWTYADCCSKQDSSHMYNIRLRRIIRQADSPSPDHRLLRSSLVQPSSNPTSAGLTVTATVHCLFHVLTPEPVIIVQTFAFVLGMGYSIGMGRVLRNGLMRVGISRRGRCLRPSSSSLIQGLPCIEMPMHIQFGCRKGKGNIESGPGLEPKNLTLETSST